VAYFYDAIPVKFPEWTPEKTVSRYPDYLRALARFDHVACISRASERDLHDAWKDLKIGRIPPTSAIPLGLPFNRASDLSRDDHSYQEGTPVVLMVGTLEARKNHLAVLQACEDLWRSGLEFQLRLIGMLNKETGTDAAIKIDQLAQQGYPVEWEGAVSNDRLSTVYSKADIFLYPSLYEGFGLPVLEALAHGLPTITTIKGALSELVEGGGCLPCGDNSAGIAESLRILLTDKEQCQKLSGEARKRPIRSMRDACNDLGSLFQELASRPKS